MGCASCGKRRGTSPRFFNPTRRGRASRFKNKQSVTVAPQPTAGDVVPNPNTEPRTDTTMTAPVTTVAEGSSDA